MAMRMSGIKMTTVVPRHKLLATLRANLAKHSAIVQEARAGYLESAKKALARKMEELQSGKIVALAFHLEPPADYSEVYRNSIEMLEWNTEDMVTLEADEFRNLVRDEWDWVDHFYASNRAYSMSARKEYEQRQADSK